MTTVTRPRLVIDCDEDDARAYRRVASLDRRRGGQQRAAWAGAEADAFARLAQQELPCFDLAFAASVDEAKSVSEFTRNVAAVPNVVLHRTALQPRRSHGAPKTILFVGTMGYAPNDDAARWLVSRVWPLLRATSRLPLRLVLAGSNPGPSLIRLGRSPGITVTGTVPDIGKFYRQADLVVVPIRAGGGTRIKLLEAAAWGVPIVSTGFGADGTTFRHDRDLLVANNAEQFARACVAVLRSRALARRLAAAARQRMALEYDAERWARRVAQLLAA
jgi:glycosyltransferase involved in cell wall biosynthesis